MGDKKYVKLKPAKIFERPTSDPVADHERPLRRIRYPLLSSHSHGKNGRCGSLGDEGLAVSGAMLRLREACELEGQ